MRICGLLIALLALSGCDRGSPEYMMQDYMSRVENTLETSIDTELDVGDKIPLFPRKRARKQATDELRQGLLEVLDLDYCEGLLHLIAQRNSSLGKVMPPSKQMTYEIRFFQLIRDCHNKIQLDSEQEAELKTRIREIYEIKKRNLAKEIYNGIYMSEEIAGNFSRSEAPIALEGDTGLDASIRVVEQFLLLAQLPSNETDWQAPTFLNEIENSFKVLYSNRYGGQLLKSLVLLTESMNATADGINAKLDSRPFCLPGHRNPRTDILRNVFAKYYSGTFQPYLSKVHRSGQIWLETNQKLAAALPLPLAMDAYFNETLSLEHPNSLWQQYIRARDRHTQAWQRLLSQCGMMPGQ